MKLHPAMKDLYERLKAVGFDRDFLGRCVLPDWWADNLAEVPANRAMAETVIASRLGLDIRRLANPRAALSLPRPKHVALKRCRDSSLEEVAPAVAICQKLAELAARIARDVPTFGGPRSASEVRQAILEQHPFVDLNSLLAFSWRHGIVVVHLKVQPEGSKRLDGLATFTGKKPVIVLASRRDGPPWLAFHLAHELGHILLGHVVPGKFAVVDGNLEAATGDDKVEKEADAFAVELLTGKSELVFPAILGMTAPKLAEAARRFGEKHRISPDVVTLFYGRSAGRMPAAQLALQWLRLSSGGQARVDAVWRGRAALEELSDGAAHFVRALTEPAPSRGSSLMEEVENGAPAGGH
jgi:hypothetical protein